MSGTKRKIFGAEFKAKVGLEAIQGLKTVNQIAQDHGVHPTQVVLWKKEMLERAGSLFDLTDVPTVICTKVRSFASSMWITMPRIMSKTALQ